MVALPRTLTAATAPSTATTIRRRRLRPVAPATRRLTSGSAVFSGQPDVRAGRLISWFAREVVSARFEEERVPQRRRRTGGSRRTGRSSSAGGRQVTREKVLGWTS